MDSPDAAIIQRDILKQYVEKNTETKIINHYYENFNIKINSFRIKNSSKLNDLVTNEIKNN